MAFVHPDAPEHNSDMYLFAHNQKIQTSVTLYFATKRYLASFGKFGKPGKEPVATKVATKTCNVFQILRIKTPVK